MVIFSEVHGQVLEAGKPVAGATVARSWDWAWGKEKSGDKTVTDAQGRFSLPLVTRRSFLGSILPHEPSVWQTMTVTRGGETIDVWKVMRRNYLPGGEPDPAKGGGAIRVECHLDADMTHDKAVYGRCRLMES